MNTLFRGRESRKPCLWLSRVEKVPEKDLNNTTGVSLNKQLSDPSLYPLLTSVLNSFQLHTSPRCGNG